MVVYFEFLSAQQYHEENSKSVQLSGAKTEGLLEKQTLVYSRLQSGWYEINLPRLFLAEEVILQNSPPDSGGGRSGQMSDYLLIGIRILLSSSCQPINLPTYVVVAFPPGKGIK